MEPIKDYIKARDAYNAGRHEEALKLLTSSMGADKPTPIMENSLGELLDLNDAALTLALHRSEKEE